MEYILIVDDDMHVAATTALLLEAAPEFKGIRIISLTDAASALRLITSDPPRALVSDYDLCHAVTGMTLMEFLHDLAPAAGRVLMSGTIDDAPSTRASAAGVRFLEKPFHPETLVESVLASLCEATRKPTSRAVMIG